MELRWYWRVLRRQWGIIWRTVAIVAVLAALFTAYSAYGSRYKSTVTLQFYQQPPIIRGTTIQIEPVQQALSDSAQAVSNAKLYTEQNEFFKGISTALLKEPYHKTIDYKIIQAGLGANITGGVQLELEYTSGDRTTAEDIVAVAVQQVQSDFVPNYNRTVVQPGVQPNITNFPIQTRYFDPPNTRSPSLSATLIGWIIKSLLGIVLGIALAFLWEYLDESIHDEQDVRNWIGAPTLGVIPGGKSRIA